MMYSAYRLLIALNLLLPAADPSTPPPATTAAHGFKTARCEGTYAQHLQGICTNERDAIYWCFTDVLVKSDTQGRVLKQVKVASHHGDLCFLRGKVFVAVNLGKFNLPAGQADSWVYVYDGETLKELGSPAAWSSPIPPCSMANRSMEAWPVPTTSRKWPF